MQTEVQTYFSNAAAPAKRNKLFHARNSFIFRVLAFYRLRKVKVHSQITRRVTDYKLGFLLHNTWDDGVVLASHGVHLTWLYTTRLHI